MLKYLEDDERYDVRLNEVLYESTHGLSIGVVRFDVGGTYAVGRVDYCPMIRPFAVLPQPPVPFCARKRAQ